MSNRVLLNALGVLIFVAGVSASALQDTPDELAEVVNFRTYGPAFASAGQPSREQFQAIRNAGFERIVYIAFTNSAQAIADEDVIVKGLGMSYLQIPVDWSNPLPSDFATFAAFMNQDPEAKTLLHCQVNARASAFSFLYRVIHLAIPVAEAKADMNSVWQPNQVWRDFIFDVLDTHEVSPECAGCDWTPSEAP